MSPEERAERRRTTWTGRVVELGEPKGLLLAHLPLADRLAALAALNARVFGTPPRTPRSEWPSEVFELHAAR